MSNEIQELTQQIMDLKGKLSEARRQAKPEPVEDYQFRTHSGDTVSLSELFAEHDDLIVIHNMGRSCQYCTLWADGFTGYLPHLENRAAFVVVSPDSPEVQKEFYESRGWNFRIYSGEGSSFIDDMGFVVDGSHLPGLSAFRRNEDGSIVRTGHDFFGPGDDYCPPYRMFDLLGSGVDGWDPRYRYNT